MTVRKHKIFLLLADISTIFLSLLVAIWIKGDFSFYYKLSIMNIANIASFLLLTASVIIVFRIRNLYKYHRLFDPSYQLSIIFKSLLVGYGVFIFALFIFKHQLINERQILVMSFFISFIIFLLYRGVLLKSFLRFALKRRIIGKRVIIVGTDTKSYKLVKQLMDYEYSYFRPVGFLDLNSHSQTIQHQDIDVLYHIDNVNAHQNEFDEFLISTSDISYNRLQATIEKCRTTGKPIHVVSDLYRVIPEKVEVEKFDGLSTFQISNNNDDFVYSFAKRVIDYTISLTMIFLLSPLWLLISLLVKITSQGPVFYKTQVVGRDSKQFFWYKFRTMYCNSDDSIHRKLISDMARGVKKDGKKIKNDERVTQIGRFLRKYSIDEFPQLVNILKGEMSLVGPRPILPYEYELLDKWQKKRFEVMPGITGLWQIRGRNEVGFNDQHVLDLYYVENRSFWLDLEIIFGTIPVVFSGRAGV